MENLRGKSMKKLISTIEWYGKTLVQNDTNCFKCNKMISANTFAGEGGTMSTFYEHGSGSEFVAACIECAKHWLPGQIRYEYEE